MIKAKITCPHCKKEHKIKHHKAGDKYECPEELKVFSIGEDLTIVPINNQLITSNTYKSAAQSDYLLPFVEFSEIALSQNDKKEAAQDIFEESAVMIGKYLLLGNLGEGGFGSVFKSYDKNLKRYVAIKILNHISNAQKIEQFKREAEVQAQLNHSNIVQIYDFGVTENQLPYIVMEYVPGKDIVTYMHSLKKDVFLKKALEIFISISEAFMYLEEKIACHQDIKPANIIFSEETKTVKLVDFGLASLNNQTVENAGYSPKYTAPERYDSQIKPSIQSDIFSLGCIMYLILTNRIAIQGKSMQEIIANTCSKEVEFFEEDKIDSDLKNICIKCLKIDLKDRYQNSKDLNIDLVEYVSKVSQRNKYPYLYINSAVFYLRKKRNYIGRSFNNDIILQEKGISRVHACISVENKNFFLENLSNSSMFISHGKVTEEVRSKARREFKHGCKIELGEKIFYFVGEISYKEMNPNNKLNNKHNYYSEQDVIHLLQINQENLDKYIAKYSIPTIYIGNDKLYPIEHVKKLKTAVSNEELTIMPEATAIKIQDTFDIAYTPTVKTEHKNGFYVYECENDKQEIVFIKSQQPISLSAYKLKHYDMVEKVGEGATGDVFRGINTRTGEEVAVKVLSRELTSDPKAAERFKRETIQIVQLKHPNIVSAHDAGDYKGRLFYVMEFISGDNVKQKINKHGVYNEKEAVQIIKEIISALMYAYQFGIVHRDIKPDNIIVTKDNIAKLCDLGLAKSIDSDRQLTLQGTLMGTPQYMPPEMIKGDGPIDCTSDIFSLGVTFYYMLTCVHPFSGIDPLTIMNQILEKDPPPIRTIDPLLSSQVESIITKMMEKERKKRYKNYEELLGDLNDLNPSVNVNFSSNPSNKISSRYRNCKAPSTYDIFVAKVALEGNIFSSGKIEKLFERQEFLNLMGFSVDLIYVIKEDNIITAKQQSGLWKTTMEITTNYYNRLFLKGCKKHLSSSEFEQFLVDIEKGKCSIVENEIDMEKKKKIYSHFAYIANKKNDKTICKLAITHNFISKIQFDEITEIYNDLLKKNNYTSIEKIFTNKNYIHLNDIQALLRVSRLCMVTGKKEEEYLKVLQEES